MTSARRENMVAVAITIGFIAFMIGGAFLATHLDQHQASIPRHPCGTVVAIHAMPGGFLTPSVTQIDTETSSYVVSGIRTVRKGAEVRYFRSWQGSFLEIAGQDHPWPIEGD